MRKNCLRISLTQLFSQKNVLKQPRTFDDCALRATATASKPYSTDRSTYDDVKYEWIYGVESLNSYQPGGFHPVTIDHIIHKRYRIVDKLGYRDTQPSGAHTTKIAIVTSR